MQLIDLPKIIKGIEIYKGNVKNINFDNIYTNSKNIKKSSIFAIKNNKSFKEEYLKEAVRNGSVAILSNRHFTNLKIPQFLAKNFNRSINLLLNTPKNIKIIKYLMNYRIGIIW